MKYDFTLDMNTNNSLALIGKDIRPNSTVLEFGPASGRLTQFLQEELGCTVYIVEIDEECANVASEYAEYSVIGDIEEYQWFSEFKNIRFEHIIFADVLEHLRYPEKVLSKSVELLCDSGTILISVPNIAHNSVLIDLLNNKFEYRSIGLLDDTHLRFFTYQSLMSMIRHCGLVSTKEQAIYKKVEETEFENYYTDVPKPIHYFLKNRAYSEIYQFVLELRKQEVLNNSEVPEKKITNIKKNFSRYFTQLYVDNGDGFHESQSIVFEVDLKATLIEFDLEQYQNVRKIRIDPIDTNAVIKLNKISLMLKSGDTLVIDEYYTNASAIIDNQLIFLTEDPQINLDCPEEEIQKIMVEVVFEEIEFDTNSKIVTTLVHSVEQQLRQSEENFRVMNHNRELTIQLSKAQQNLADLITQNNKLTDSVSQLQEDLMIKEYAFESKSNEFLEHIDKLQKQLREIYDSKYWNLL